MLLKSISHAALTVCILAIGGVANAQEVVRHKTGSFPIATAVEVPAGRTTVYLSGKVPQVVDANASANSLEAFGDTKAQTVNIMKQIEDHLRELNLTMGDIVKMQVYLVGGPENDGKMDFAGFMEGYTQFFGDAANQPSLPARSVFQVAGLANPGWRVEIEVIAVRPAAH